MNNVFMLNNNHDDSFLVTFHSNEKLSIAVTEEKAMDSYNEDVECTTYLTKDEALRLISFLNEKYAHYLKNNTTS